MTGFLVACTDVTFQFSPEVEARLPKSIDFNYHVKPILSDKCFACHGPDENKIKGGLRLDLEAHALAALESGTVAISPGKPGRSEMYHRITSADPEYLMPPPESHLVLTDYEKAILIRWIEQGAEYKAHWSYVAPRQSRPPRVEDQTWGINPIDQFVVARLEREGLKPAIPAEKTTLIRRLSFDLTGLPPTLEEIDAFLADREKGAYERVVDRLLASDHYGERMATEWLDVARYADSHGFHADGYRLVWPWRDWVISAFNDNLPYNDFITWQMAGDLLPNATLEQRLATGFHRNNPVNSESGIVPEEYRLENVFDRTNTTAKAFLGLTMECARCHDHKYDPISQKEYYQLSAFFNNVDELGMMSVDGNAAPTMLYMDEQVEEIVAFIRDSIDAAHRQLEARVQAVTKTAAYQQVELDPGFRQDGLIAHYPLDRTNKGKTPNLANPTEMARLHGDVEIVAGRTGQALRFDSEYEHLTLAETADFERYQSFSAGAWVHPEGGEGYRSILSNAGHKNEHWRGFELMLDSLDRVGVRLTHRPPDHQLLVWTAAGIANEHWNHVFFTYDGSSRSSGIRIYVNGKPVPLEIQYDRLEKSIRPINAKLQQQARALRVGRSYRIALELGVFTGSIDEIRIYNRQLSELEAAALYGEPATEKSQLLTHYLSHEDEDYQLTRQRLQDLRIKEHFTLDTVPEVMVMREMAEPRTTYVLNRGEFDNPTEAVQAGTPSLILPFDAALPANRLGLADWLVHPDNPLTARVIVNRYWNLIFGRGIVHTLEDFGNQGALPSHPELLDWLAVEFIESGWDLKALVRLMVTSATYRQSSVADSELLRMDPQNELLARGSSHRLPAEMIRDNALAASGLLVRAIGGPSVKTYQPDDLWSNTHFSKLLTNYQADEGSDLYRRSLYTFVRRTAPPATMTIMDAPDRSMCVVKRQNTSTPLQALLLLNEPQMLEAARGLAERIIKRGEPSIERQLNDLFRLLTSRSILPEELSVMTQLFDEELQKFRADEADAIKLLEVGSFARDTTLELAHVAALTVVANVIMNYDETYTKR